MAVDTLGHLLALHVTPASAEDRGEVECQSASEKGSDAHLMISKPRSADHPCFEEVQLTASVHLALHQL